MVKKKNQDRPKHVSIYFDQLIYDLDFMPNEYAGIILKMIVWYSAGTEEGKEHIANMQKHIDTLPERAWLTAMCKRLFKCIDEDMQAYIDQCEKQRKRIQDYWDKRNTDVNHGIPRNTTVNNSIPMNTITDTDTDTDTEPIDKEEEEECVREEKIKDAPLRADDFVRIWNAAIAGALRKSETTPMKRLKVEELPSDAELRIHNALNIIERDLSEKDIERVCEEQNLNRAKCSVRDIAKWYMVMAMGRYARVTMKSRDSSFGSFNWFVNYPLRIKKLFNGDIQ